MLGENHMAAWTENQLTVVAYCIASNGNLDELVDKGMLGRTRSAIEQFIQTANAGDVSSRFTASHRRFLALVKEHTDRIQDEKEKAIQKKQKKTAANGLAPIKHRAKWTETDDNKLLKMFCTNVCPEVMAGEMNRTVNSILGRLHALGVLSFDKDQGCYYTKTPYYRVVNPDLQS